MSTKKNKEKSCGLIKAWKLATVLFGISAGLFYLAYTGIESGTTAKTKRYSPWVPHQRGQVEYDGVYSRDKDSRQFWIDEIFCMGVALVFAIGGLQILREEYKEHRQDNFLSVHHFK